MKKQGLDSMIQKNQWPKEVGKKIGFFCLSYLGLILLCGAALLPGDDVFDAYKDDSNHYRVKL